MKLNYFAIETSSVKAIDNVTIYGVSVLEPCDIARLISAHAKYPYSLRFYLERPDGELDNTAEVLEKLDNMVLHKKHLLIKEVFDRYDSLYVKPTDVYKDGGYYYIDFSGGEFKTLSKDRTAMLEENRRVYQAMDFLFKHGCEFEYAGSRAKIRIPIHHFSNRHLIYWTPCSGNDYKILECGVYHVETKEEIVEVETI